MEKEKEIEELKRIIVLLAKRIEKLEPGTKIRSDSSVYNELVRNSKRINI